VAADGGRDVTLAAAAHDYLRVRRALGYKLDRQGRQLWQFVAYLDDVGATTVTIEHALGWATLPPDATGGYWCDRLSVVRQFARFLQTIDPACEVPPKGLLSYGRERPIPFLFTREDIELVMRAADGLRGDLHARTTQTLIGLMAVTGIRVGEAIGLARDDVRPGQLIRVIDTKFGKSREVAVHETTIAALDSYAEARDRICPAPQCEAFFLSGNGTRLRYQCVRRVFMRLVAAAGLEDRSPRSRPRPHSLRHSFAVNTLRDWYADDVDVQARLPLLTTHMGHVTPASTYYYLTAAPDLLAWAARRLEQTTERTPDDDLGTDA
jgi:integrase/recombinase XerD